MKKIKILVVVLVFVSLITFSVFSLEEKINLGTYKIKHKFKEDLYNFNDYEMIKKNLKGCLNEFNGVSDIDILKDAFETCLSLKTKMQVNVDAKGDYLLFNVNTGKMVLVNDGLHDIVIKFAVKL